MLFTTPPTIEPREVATIVVQQSDWLSVFGDVATVLAGLAAAAGLYFTGRQTLEANRREKQREYARALRVGLKVRMTYEARRLPAEVGGDTAFAVAFILDAINGNDTSITDVTFDWRPHDTRGGAIKVETNSQSISVVQPHTTSEAQYVLTATVGRDFFPSELHGHFDGDEDPVYEQYYEIASHVQEHTELAVHWELDGYLWRRWNKESGPDRVGSA